MCRETFPPFDLANTESHVVVARAYCAVSRIYTYIYMQYHTYIVLRESEYGCVKYPRMQDIRCRLRAPAPPSLHR